MRRVELWSVFRLSSLALLALYVITLGAFALLWWIASNTGTVHNIEKFLRDVGFKNFHFDGPQLMGGVAAVGAVLVLAGSLLATVMAAVFNVLSEMTGGVGVVVIEEAPIPTQPSASNRSPDGIAEGNGGAHVARSAAPIADRVPQTASATSAVRPDSGKKGSAAASRMVRRARSVMGVAAARFRQAARVAAQGLAGDGRGDVKGSGVDSGDGSGGGASGRGGDGRGGVKGSGTDSGDGSGGRAGGGRARKSGATLGSGDGSGGDRTKDPSGDGVDARSRAGKGTK